MIELKLSQTPDAVREELERLLVVRGIQATCYGNLKETVRAMFEIIRAYISNFQYRRIPANGLHFNVHYLSFRLDLSRQLLLVE